MITKARRIIKNAIDAVTKDVSKKAGLRIYRKVGNAQKWADWLTASGIPNAKGADDLQVTIITALGDVQVIPDQKAYVIPSTSGVFCVIGGDMCFAWYDYGYYDRHWALREVAQCEVCHYSRAVLVLGEAVGDFEFSDESLLSAPASLVLDGESTESMPDVTTVVVEKSARETITPNGIQVAKANQLLTASFDDASADPMQQAALEDLTHGKPVSKAQILEDLGVDMAVDLGLLTRTRPKALETPATETIVEPEVDVRKTAEVTTSRTVDVVKRAPERRMMYGWASVATVDGKDYEDLHGDTIEVDALHDICELVVMEGQNAGGIEHDGTDPNSIAAAIVIDDDFAAAMSDNFYFEGDVLKTKKQGLFVGYHFRDPDDWESAKDQPLEFSINGTAFIADPQES